MSDLRTLLKPAELSGEMARHIGPVFLPDTPQSYGHLLGVVQQLPPPPNFRVYNALRVELSRNWRNGRAVVTNNKLDDTQPELNEACQDFMSDFEAFALATVREAVPRRQRKKLHVSDSRMTVGRSLSANRWHSDGKPLYTPPSFWRFSLSQIGTQFAPDGTSIPHTFAHEKDINVHLKQNPVEPVYRDGKVSVFTDTTIHRSPNSDELRAQRDAGERVFGITTIGFEK